MVYKRLIMNNQNDKMHPEDTRNLMIFCVISLVLYLGYEHFILGPQKETLEKMKEAQRAQQQVVIEQVVDEPAATPLERSEIIQQSARIAIQNEEIFGSINTQGGRIDDIGLHGYFETLDKETNVSMLSPKGAELPRYVEHGWVSSDTTLNLPKSDTQWRVVDGSVLEPQRDVVLEWDNGVGLVFTKTYSVDGENMITVKQSVINNSAERVSLVPYGLVAQRGLPKDMQSTWILHAGPIGYVGDELHEVSYKSLRKEPTQTYQGDQGWAGITDKYWLTAVIPTQNQDVTYNFRRTGDLPGKKQKDKGLFQVDYTGQAIELAPGGRGYASSRVLSGPKRYLQLRDYSDDLGVPRLDLAVNFGWLWFMSKPFFYILHWLGEVTGNFGIGIILLTIVIRSAVFPLTNASFKSFAKMKKVTPQVMKLREKHGDDKQALQTELMQMYQKEGVNPMAGCFPMLLQIPIFFALYKVLFITIEMRHAPFYGWIKDLSAADPTSVFNLFGLIPWDPPGILMIGVWPCLMLVAMVLQRKLNPPPQDPIQRDMANYFPFMMAFMMARFASGLVIYWTFSAAISVIQQMIIMKRMNVPIYLFSKDPAEAKLNKQVDDGPAVHPIAEMVEDEVEDALFDEHPPKEISPPKPKKKVAGKKSKPKKKK